MSEINYMELVKATISSSARPYLPSHHPKQKYRIEKAVEWIWRTTVTAGGMGLRYGEGWLIPRRASVGLFIPSVI